ncbi:MAG: rhomboid family intramembrane serine protease [Opitutales bacterium]
MLYDRPYMRQPYDADRTQVSAVTALLIVTISVFVLQHILLVFFPSASRGESTFMIKWFALSADNFRDLKVWTVLSYTFLHSTITFFHILGNMLGLFFIGRVLEPILGPRRFLVLYFGGAFLGGLIYLLLHLNGESPLIGASAAVIALLTFFCFLRPEQSITLLLFFILPITLKPKWVFRGFLAISTLGLLFYELPSVFNEGVPQRGGVAHSAHLGGMLGGILFHRLVHLSNMPFTRRSLRPKMEPPEWMKRKQKIKNEVSYTVNRTNRETLQKEVNRILDKINTSGFGSLSEQEKKTLDRARDILKK